MAKAKSKAYENPNFKGFVNYQLDKSEKELLRSKPYSDEDFSTWLWRFSEAGYKFTFTYQTQQNAFQCVATHTDEKHINFGIFMSGRGSSPLKAFKQWQYIHVEVCAEVWPDWLELKRDGEIDD